MGRQLTASEVLDIYLRKRKKYIDKASARLETAERVGGRVRRLSAGYGLTWTKWALDLLRPLMQHLDEVSPDVPTRVLIRSDYEYFERTQKRLEWLHEHAFFTAFEKPQLTMSVPEALAYYTAKRNEYAKKINIAAEQAETWWRIFRRDLACRALERMQEALKLLRFLRDHTEDLEPLLPPEEEQLTQALEDLAHYERLEKRMEYLRDHPWS